MDIKIATIEDLDLISPLFDAYRQEYDQLSDLNACRDFLKERLINNEFVMLIAINHLEYVGFIQIYPTYSSVSLKKLWVLTDLYVSPPYRKMGIAKRLINDSKKLAQDPDSVGIVIESRISSHSAQRLYDSVGFKKDGEHLYYYLE